MNSEHLKQCYNQLSSAIKSQPVECQCKRKIPSWKMYRCFYCGKFFCRKCAKDHFEQTVKPKDFKFCPQCGESLIFPRNDSPYCEECGFPDEWRK